jgi:phage baseplate assembly protein W
MPAVTQIQEKFLVVPFQISASGSVAVSSNPVVAAKQEILTVMLTQQGERLMHPEVGNPVEMQLFDPVDEESDFAASLVRDALDTQLVRSNVVSIAAVEPNRQPGMIALDVEFTPVPFGATYSLTVETGT